MLEILKEKYEIIRRIGQGGMAEIYLAKDKKDNKQVAIKLLHADKQRSQQNKKRFKEEIKLTQKVNSPYVVKVFDSYWDDNIQYIVMEYIEGEILKEYIARRSRLTADEAVEFTRQLASGLDAIHKRGIVHRDIKASNILVTEHGSLKIIDFGIAITSESERLTKTDSVIGSVHYIAPEVLEQKPLTMQSDIYALGILMFEMLTGDVPFKENDAIATAMKHKKSTVPHVNKFFESVPQAVSNVVIKATSKDLTRRYKTMGELYEDVNTSLKPERSNEKMIDLSVKPKKTFKQIVNSRTMLISIISFLIVSLVAIIIILSMGVI